MRTGKSEVLGLRWQDVDLPARHVAVRQTLVEVAYELHFSEPKTKRSRRTVSIDAVTSSVIAAHRERQDEERFALGPLEHDLLFLQPVRGTRVEKARERRHGGPCQSGTCRHRRAERHGSLSRERCASGDALCTS